MSLATKLEADPLGKGGLHEFGRRFRSGELTSEAATRAYLSRIDALDGRLRAFEHVEHESSVSTARAMDELRQAGTDLGPLMGVPIAIKDLIAVNGMPTRAGTFLDVSDLIGSEGPVVAALRRAGCVIIGKTKTVEFALGATGISEPRGTPINPWDSSVSRLPGGSSSGSGVAVAAGLCAFALGSDTGGSVRVPAALNGIFGMKTTTGLLPNDGAFALARHLDSIGYLTRSAHDAAIVHGVLTGKDAVAPASISGIRLGRPLNYFFDDLTAEVQSRTASALAALCDAGARIVEIEVPEAPEREVYFPTVLPVYLLAELGRDRAEAGMGKMDPVVARRIGSGFDTKAVDLLQLEARRNTSRHTAVGQFEGVDAWVMPTTMSTAARLSDLDDPLAGMEAAFGVTRNTQPGNYLDLCGVSIPIRSALGELPVGLQLLGPPNGDRQLLMTALACEQVLGSPELPDVTSFADGPAKGSWVDSVAGRP